MSSLDFESFCKENGREELLNEWDYKKNNDITPSAISYGSNKVICWIGKCGHSYDMRLGMRTLRNCGCPFCSGRRTLKGFNDIATTNLELIDEWNFDKNELSPFEVSAGSDKRVWWRCELGHEWQAVIHNRTSLSRGCPYCSGRKTLPGFNDLETWCKENAREDLVDEWNAEKNDISMSRISPSNNKKVWWKCSLGHEWDATISSRTGLRPAGCPYCSNPPKRILLGFNDFASWCSRNHMEYLLKEWNYDKNVIDPENVTFGSGERVWWKCNKNHEWRAQIHNRTNGSKTNCPICSRTQTSFPEQAIAFYLIQKFDILQRYKIKGYEVDIFVPNYNIAIEYDGNYFHERNDTILRDQKKSRTLEAAGVKLIRLKETSDKQTIKNGVIYFSASNGKYITESFEWALNKLIDTISKIIGEQVHIDINMRRDELDIRAHYMNVLKDNSVASVYPELTTEWDVEKNKGVEANAFSAHNNKKVWWRCKKGHSWMASIHSRTANGLGCPFCAGQRTIRGENDLVTWCEENGSNIICEWDYEKNDLSPSEYQKTSNKKVWWKCAKGHEWMAAISNRVHGTDCPVCNTGREVRRNKISLREWCESNNNLSLLDEWDHEKNGEKTPDSSTYGSHAKVWWKCEKGHEWQAVIKSRTYNHGCPYCSPTYKKVLVGVNDLLTWCGENNKEYIIEEWNYEKNNGLKPEDVTKGSHKKVWWKCSENHEWEAVVKERTKINGNKCPYCQKE